jgi:uncharacterized protein (TIGR04255 family)
MMKRGESDRLWLLDPLTGPLAPEIPLPNAPLVRVIAQVRFPMIASIPKPAFIGTFQEAIRDRYTDLSWVEPQATGVALGPEGIAVAREGGLWRFETPGDGWSVSLAPQFVALEATRYSSRTDFLERLKLVLEAIAEHVKPRTAQRLGVRYVDRLDRQRVEEIAHLVRPEVLGVSSNPFGERLLLSITETAFRLDAGQLRARWGLLPADSTYDPSALEPRPTPSWVLDLDMFRVEDRPFDSAELLAEARTFSSRIYTLFRWAVTDDFISRFGGNP